MDIVFYNGYHLQQVQMYIWYLAQHAKLKVTIPVQWSLDRRSSYLSFAVEAIKKCQRFPGQSCFASLIWDCIVTELVVFVMPMTTRWQCKPVTQSVSNSCKPRSVAVERLTDARLFSTHISFCTLTPLYWVWLFTLDIFNSLPSDKGHYYLWPTGNYSPVNKGVLDSHALYI